MRAVETRREHDKLRFIGLFIGTAVIGLALILFAVYNASRELAIVKEIDLLHESLRERSAALSAVGAGANAAELARRLSTETYPVSVLSGGRDSALSIPGVPDRIATAEVEASRVSERGGYLNVGEGGVAWASITLPAIGGDLLVAHSHRPLTGKALLGVYRNRLIVPALFYVWAAVWVSFILNNLVTRLRAQKDELERMAWYDALTGLPNRNLLFQRLDDLVGRAENGRAALFLAVVDLDGFKQVNDTFGHHAGDELLRQVAVRFRHAVRRGDTVARTGGDEFILLLTDPDPAACEAVCQRILEALTQPYRLPDRDIKIGASLGLARFPHDGRDTAVLTRKADQAMYEAKRSGGGIVCYSGEAPALVGS